MLKNDLIQLKITDMNNLGYAVGRLDDKAPDATGIVVFVNGAVPGDTVRAKVIKVTRSYLVARLEEVITPSPYRAKEDFCAAPNSCGGCNFRHVQYQYELEYKRNIVKGEFIKEGLGDVNVLDVLHTGDGRGYRNKAQYPVGCVNGRTVAGFYAKKSHNIVACDGCALQPSVFAEIVEFICDFADNNKIPAYDEESGKGILRHIYLRQGKATGEIMVCLVVTGELSCADGFAAGITRRFPAVASVMLNFNREKTNVVLGDKFRCVLGKPYIEDILCGKRFRISAGSFYQVNHDAAEILYSLAAEKAGLKGNETLLDLYCGAGTIGLSMCDKVKKLVGIEIVPEAVECAKVNAALNNCQNAAFFCGDASDTKKLLDNAERELGRITPDVVIIDPPAKGSTPELINFLAERGIGRIVYVSCGPDTLARDCALFRKLGYTIGDVTPVDMFPRTGHVETCCLLTRREKSVSENRPH